MRNKVAYFYDPEISDHHYGTGHPMKPQRMRMTHSLILSYKLHRKIQMFKTPEATFDELAAYHSPDYLTFMKSKVNLDFSTVANDEDITAAFDGFNLLPYYDNPIFKDVFRFSAKCAGGSIAAAKALMSKDYDIAINWSGGLHHARKGEADGFCYVNDIVLGILELLKVHKRVLYIDIDIHHGDGVEEAFYFSDRVFTCSFHRYGDGFFPGTGALTEIGEQEGKFCCANFPLKDGITDADFLAAYEPIISKIVNVYDPGAIVLQCGADSLLGDRIGTFAMSVAGHGRCVQFTKKFGLPLMVLGGGGYTVPNVARCWAYETAVCAADGSPESLLASIDNGAIPKDDAYYTHYAPNYTLECVYSVEPSNNNPASTMSEQVNAVLHNVGLLKSAPSVQFQ